MPSGTEPLPPTTGISNPNCYLASFNDCSQETSAEHYISKVILKKIADNGKTLFLGGSTFSPDQVRKLSVANMTSKILCSRHNSALSPLDTEAGRLFSDLLLTKQNGVALNSDYCGEDLERWMLKVMIGLLCAGIVGNADGTTLKIPPASWMLNILLGRREFNAGAGLGVFPSHEAPPHSPIEITINSEKGGTHIYGIRVCLLGINFHLMTAKTFHDKSGQYFHRPCRLEMGNLATFNFGWLPGKSGPSLILQKA